uniref:dUTPase-like domain-containing protein n=1 Tax=Anser brachyrhynchus TaxID=132585 RepID=A0A8B9BAS6_9AVES
PPCCPSVFRKSPRWSRVPRCSPAATITTVDTLSARTRGSAGVDVSTVIDATLCGTHVHKIPLNVKGPVGNDCSVLLLGRSSTTLTGLFVLPGIIDADYNGQIQAMAWTPSPPLSIQKGTRIAQLILFRAVVCRSWFKNNSNKDILFRQTAHGIHQCLSSRRRAGNGDYCFGSRGGLCEKSPEAAPC